MSKPEVPPGQAKKPTKEDLQGKAKGQRGARFLTVNDLREVKKGIPSADERRALILDYYLNTPEGQEEYENSPHPAMGRSVEEVVEELCREIDGWKGEG